RRPGGRRVRPGAAGPARPGGRADPAAQERGHHVLLRTARGTAGDRLRPGSLHRGRLPAAPGNLRGRGESAVRAPDGLSTQEDVAGELSLEWGGVVVGSGAGGATVAAELAGAGVDVIVLEEGGYHPTESFTASTGRALRTLYRDGGGGMAIGRPSVLYAEGRCVGGSTVVNGGMSWREPGPGVPRGGGPGGAPAPRGAAPP